MKPRFFVEKFGHLNDVERWLNQKQAECEAAGLVLEVSGFTTVTTVTTSYYLIARAVRL